VHHSLTSVSYGGCLALAWPIRVNMPDGRAYQAFCAWGKIALWSHGYSEPETFSTPPHPSVVSTGIMSHSTLKPQGGSGQMGHVHLYGRYRQYYMSGNNTGTTVPYGYPSSGAEAPLSRFISRSFSTRMLLITSKTFSPLPASSPAAIQATVYAVELRAGQDIRHRTTSGRYYDPRALVYRCGRQISQHR
jgi:hypothetical protein